MNAAAPVGIDTTVPSAARMWDWYLGGKDNFAADRAAAEGLAEICRRAGAPTGREIALEGRAFLIRTVTTLAQAGVTQFIDLGAGLPTQGNVHQIAQATNPLTRVVYVDNDPIVVVHGQNLLATDQGTTAAIAGDLRRPLDVLTDAEVLRLIDFDRPVGVLLVAVLHLLTDEENPAHVVAQIRDSLPPGSYLVLSHVTGDARPGLAARVAAEFASRGVSTPLVPRSRAEISAFLDGFDLLPPGLVFPSRWRPGPHDPADDGTQWMYAGVGHLPNSG